MLIHKNWTVTEVLQRTWKINLIILMEVGVAILSYEVILKNYFVVPAVITGLLGTAIAFFIGFMNNQAYDRWWEARKIWGSIVNDTRSWARGVLAYMGDDTNRAEKEKMVKRQLAWLHLLKHHLRGTESSTHLTYLPKAEQVLMKDVLHKPNTVLLWQSRDLEREFREGRIDGFRFKALDELLVRMTDWMGKCERIKNTVFPTSYMFFTKFFIFIFISLAAMTLYDAVGWIALLFGWIVGFVFYATYYNGVMILDPFENLPSDTPMSALTRTLERNLLEMLDEPDLPAPLESVRGEYIL